MKNSMYEFAEKCRINFHLYPELSGKEENTSKFIEESLKEFGRYKVYRRKNNILAVWDSGKQGKNVLLRADIDALPMQENENNLKQKKHYVSQIENAAHTCGHDFHTAIMLGVAKACAENMNLDYGKIGFAFESGEENGSGVADMLDMIEESGLNPDTCFGIHVYADLEVGKVALQPGPVMAGATSFRVEIIGKGGHGSRPDKTIDPISCAAQIINSLHFIPSRVVDPFKTVTLSIGTLHAGTTRNIIPNECVFEGTSRFYDLEEEKKVLEAFEAVIKNICGIHNCQYNISFRGPGIPVSNDEKSVEIAVKAAEEAMPENAVAKVEPWMASDSMARYLDKYTGVYALLGIRDLENGYGAAHHNDRFDVPEVCLKYGMDLAYQFVQLFMR